jgi:predicted transcriptional regulator
MKMARRKVNLEKLLELYKMGLSDYRIGKILNVTHWTVRQWRLKLGLPPKHQFRKKPKIVDIEKLKQLYNQGLTYEEIAKQLGVSKGTVNTYITKYKLANRQHIKKGSHSRIKSVILSLVDQKVYVTADDLSKYLNQSKVSIRNHLKALEKEGLLRRFTLATGATGRQKFSGSDFFKSLNPKGKITLFYSDTRKFIEKLCEIVDLDKNDLGKRVSFTRLLRDNNFTDDEIKLFYKLKFQQK